MYKWCFFLLVLSLLQLVTLERRYSNERDICSNRYPSLDQRIVSYGTHRIYKLLPDQRRTNLPKDDLYYTIRDAESVRSPNYAKSERERVLVRVDTNRNNYERDIQRNVHTRRIDPTTQRMRQLFRETPHIGSDPLRTNIRQHRFVRNPEINTRTRDMLGEYNKENKDTRIRMGNGDERQYGRAHDQTIREADVTRRYSVYTKLNEIRSDAPIISDRAIRFSVEERRTRDNRERMNIHQIRTFRHSSDRQAINNLLNLRMIQGEKLEERLSTERSISKTQQGRNSRQHSSNSRGERQESRLQRSRILVSRDRVLVELRHNENARENVVRNERNSQILTRDRHLKREYTGNKNSDYNTREIRLNRSENVRSRMRILDELTYENTRENTERNTRRSLSPIRERQLLERENRVNKRSSDNTQRIRLDTSRNVESRERNMDQEATRQEKARRNLYSMHRNHANEEINRREIRQNRSRVLSRQRATDELNEHTRRMIRINFRDRESPDKYNYRSRSLLSRERNVNELIRNENKGENNISNRSRSLTMTRDRDVRTKQYSKKAEENIRYVGLTQCKRLLTPKREMAILSERRPRDYGNNFEVLSVFPYNLEYLFYVIQGIYLLNLIMNSFKADEMKKKAKITDWLAPANYLKTQ